jgi:ribonuclease HI
MVLYDQEDVREVWVARKYFFVVQTRFQAEYRGLALALRYIRQQGVRKLVVQTDNKVILEQLDGKYQVRKAQLKQLYWTAISLKETFDEFTTTPIAAIENSRAGNLARRAVATRKSFGIEGLEHPPTNSHKESTSTLSEEVTFSPDETYLLRFDGASRGNPGSAGAGMVIYGQDGKELWCGCKYVGNNNTNNEAEYTAVLMGLKCAVSLGITKLIVEGDSILVVRQLLGEYRVKSGKLEGLYAASKTIIDHHLQSCEIRHIARNENTRADELANHAVDTKQSYGFEEEE